MLGETDLVGVFWVRVVRIDGLRPVRVLRRLGHLPTLLAVVGVGRGGGAGAGAGAGGSEAGLDRVALGAWRSTGISRYGGGGLEAAQLGGSVHLRGVARSHGIRAGTKCAGHGAAAAEGTGLLLVQGE